MDQTVKTDKKLLAASVALQIANSNEDEKYVEKALEYLDATSNDELRQLLDYWESEMINAPSFDHEEGLMKCIADLKGVMGE